MVWIAPVVSHLAALAIFFFTEHTLFGIALALLSWGLLNAIFLLIWRRPAICAALSLALVAILIVLSLFKFGIIWMTATFLDVLVIDSDTANFLIKIFPDLQMWLLISALVGVPLVILLWWLDPFRVPRRVSLAIAIVCLAGIAPLSLAVPEHPSEPFQGVNHVSNFSRSGVYALSQLMAAGWIDAAPRAVDPVTMTSDEPCRPTGKLPHIIVILDESSFDASAAPGIELPVGYERHFQSVDGRSRSLLVEATGGPTWYSEYNLLTGLSARSYGKLMYYVTRIAAERVERGLPRALKRCGYRTFTLYPTLGDFLSARRFQKGVGIDHFIDQNAMGVYEEINPDSFFYDQTVKLIAGERGAAPIFVFMYLTANHFPWNLAYRPDLTPDWKAPGNSTEVDEYLRRQTMSARDYSDFVSRLKREFPNESFLLVRFGDHQPSISTRMLDPSLDQAEIARRVMANDPRYFTTYYAIDAVNFKPAPMSSASDLLEAPYLPLVIQEAAGVPLDPSFAEQKRIFERCAGSFYFCASGEEARRFNRLLIDAGLIHGL